MFIEKTKIVTIKDDITLQQTDTIVNAANSSLFGGGGVDGAIHRAGGPKILEECKKIRSTEYQDGLPTGKAVITSAGKLKAKYVLHTVGPIWYGGKKGEPELLKNCYFNCLKLAVENNIETISFPSISTGAYGYPIEKSSLVAINAIRDFLSKQKHNFSEIRFVLFSDHDLQIYERNLL